MSAAETPEKPEGNPLAQLAPDDWAHAFLEAYTGPIGYGTLSKSLKHAHTSKDKYKTRLANDLTFKTLLEEAQDQLRDQIRHELYNRALNGTQRPIYQHGHIVGHATEIDNRLLTWLAERLMPEEFHLATKFELTANNTTDSYKFAMNEAPAEPPLELESGA